MVRAILVQYTVGMESTPATQLSSGVKNTNTLNLVVVMTVAAIQTLIGFQRVNIAIILIIATELVN